MPRWTKDRVRLGGHTAASWLRESRRPTAPAPCSLPLHHLVACAHPSWSSRRSRRSVLVSNAPLSTSATPVVPALYRLPCISWWWRHLPQRTRLQRRSRRSPARRRPPCRSSERDAKDSTSGLTVPAVHWRSRRRATIFKKAVQARLGNHCNLRTFAPVPAEQVMRQAFFYANWSLLSVHRWRAAGAAAHCRLVATVAG